MIKQKKNLLILGGVIAGVLVVALGAFALNPEGVFYKGEITTTVDTKLVEEDLKSESLTTIEIETKTEEPAPLPDPPPPPEEEEELPVIEIAILSPAITDNSDSDLGDPPKIEVSPPPTILTTKILAPQLLSSLVPVISGYNPTNTPYLPASYGSDAVVLYFDVNVGGTLYKQSDNIYLHDFYVEYNDCLGNSYQPKTIPTLWSREYGIWMARDVNMDGKFSVSDNEFNYTYDGIPISAGNGYEFSIRMEVDSTMCPAGSFAQVIVKDILWKDANGDFHLDDPKLENDIVTSFNDEYSIQY